MAHMLGLSVLDYTGFCCYQDPPRSWIHRSKVIEKGLEGILLFHRVFSVT